jgi:branched-chain amino acid transport system permease protein
MVFMARSVEGKRFPDYFLRGTFRQAFGCSRSGGGIAGALLGANYPIYPTMGANPVLKAFVVLVLGGVGSLTGAIIGGLVLGIVEVMAERPSGSRTGDQPP